MAGLNKKKSLLVALAVLVAGMIAWQVVKHRMIREKAPEWVAKKTKGLYAIRYGDVYLDEVSGTLRVGNVAISPDTQVYAAMLKEGNDPPLLIKAAIPMLEILGVKTPKALLTRSIKARTLEIKDAVVNVLVGRRRPARGGEDPLKEVQAALLTKFKSLRIDTVRLVHTSFSVRRMRDNEPELRMDSLSLCLTGFGVDSLLVRDSTRILFSRELTMHTEGFHIASGSRTYDLQVEGLGYTSSGDVLSVDRLKWKPRLSEAAFAASFPVAKDRYDFSLGDIRLLHLDRKGLWEDKISADSLLVGRSSFKVYCDVSRPHSTASQKGKFPQQLIRKLPFVFSIHTTLFTRTYIEYKEKNASSDSAGKLQFFDGRARIRNLTNDPARIGRNDRCLLEFHGRFLDKTAAEIRLGLLLNDPRAGFFVEGKLDSMDAPDLNPMVEPMGLFKVQKGAVRNFHFMLQGNDSACKGRLTLAYKGANLAFLKWKDDRFEKKLLPSLSMSVVMRHSNPTGNGLPQTVSIGRRRRDRDSFISYVWKAVFGGIRRTIIFK